MTAKRVGAVLVAVSRVVWFTALLAMTIRLVWVEVQINKASESVDAMANSIVEKALERASK